MFDDDVSEFLDPADFADVATYSGTGNPVNGILDANFVDALGQVQANAPTFKCASSDVPDARQGETLTFAAATKIAPAGAVFKIRSVEPDGHGLTLLRLAK